MATPPPVTLATPSFSAQMYMCLCLVGAATSLTQLPVLISLFNSRQPGILGSLAVCTSWIIFFDFLERAYSFLIAFVSVSRAIGLACPCHMFTNVWIFWGLVVYTAVRVGVETVAIFTESVLPGFSDQDGFCSLRGISNTGDQIVKIIFAIDAYLIWATTCVSLVISIQKLLALHAVKKLRKFSREASLTAILIIILNLLLTIPLLISRTVDLTNLVEQTSSKFLQWKFKLFCHVICVVVNAPLNAILLWARTPRIKTWKHGSKKARKNKITEYSDQLESDDEDHMFPEG